MIERERERETETGSERGRGKAEESIRQKEKFMIELFQQFLPITSFKSNLELILDFPARLFGKF